MSSFTSASDEQQRLRVGVDGDELHALEPGVDHAVDGVAATAADADDLDHREVVLRSAEHRTAFLRTVRSELPSGATEVLAELNPRSQLQVENYVNLWYVSRLYRRRA